MAAPDHDHYAVLGVSESATPDEIRAAYLRAARTSHPDLHPTDPSAGDRFKAIQRAYEVLSDPRRRAAYRRPGAYRRVVPSHPGSGVQRPAPLDLHALVPPDLWDTIEAARIVARRRLGRRFRQLIRYLEGL